MDGNGRVVVNLATGLEDPERVTVAFFVAGAAAAAGKQVTIFLTKEAVRLALPGVAVGVACDGCPALATLATQFAEAGGLDEQALSSSTHRSAAQRRCGNGSATARRSSATSDRRRNDEETRSVERSRRCGGCDSVGRRDCVCGDPERGRCDQRLLSEERGAAACD